MRCRPVGSSLHRTVMVELDGVSTEIDEAMAEVIAALWDCGIRTRACCQGELDADPSVTPVRDWAYVMFESIDGLRAFLELFEGTELANRRSGQRWQIAPDGTMMPDLPRRWTFGAGVHESHNDDELFIISGTVRFPAVDLSLVRRRLLEVVDATQQVDASKPAPFSSTIAASRVRLKSNPMTYRLPHTTGRSLSAT